MKPFWGAYDPRLRKARGVWYTPEPVVKFIVRAVDDILKTEFGLKDGLADASKTKVKVKVPTHDKRYKAGQRDYEQEVHKVQILDPATGTGTFLAEVIKRIYRKFEGQQGIWSNYVENHLLPRLNGFEILMASYAMAHLKLDLLLTETGYKPQKEQRFKIYLTNSLEEHHPDTGTLFAGWLSSEANEANHIKRDTPVMCVIGNPPYSGISSNMGEWIVNLIEDYKYVNGKHFNERKHWLNDDYVKFIRYGQYYIEKNGEGVLGFINPHGFLDNPTFRGMRWNLLKIFDKIYTIDLHGNAKKNEYSPDGAKDENVFDITQGVSINLLIKTGRKEKNHLAQVFHHDLLGKKELKYASLWENSISSIGFKNVNYQKPNYFFVPKDYDAIKQYSKGFSTSELFITQSMGITSARDSFVIDIDKNQLLDRIKEFSNLELSDTVTRERFFGDKKEGKYLKGDTRGWKMTEARKAISDNSHENFILPISYRPFDLRTMYYSPNMVDWGREEVMNNLIPDNFAICLVKLGRDADAHNYFITNHITDKSITSSLDNANVFPLYIYPDTKGQQTIDGEQKRTPNLNMEIVDEISPKLGLTFNYEKETTKDTFAPIDILDYIYAILHNPTYREKYKEFLKIDFPRVPYPKDQRTFWQLVKLGGEIRQIHLLESPKVEQYITTYPVDGDNTVGKPKYEDGKVWINDEQYFDKVPQVSWEFYIGANQIARLEDILHELEKNVAP